nr:helix-turn-helix domain-containing protein [Providencia sp. PROV152]
MSAESSGRFTLKELNRIKVLQDVIDRKMTPGRAAMVLGITPRHCSRLIKRYRELDDYNHRFGKLPRHEYDVHRPLEQDEDLDTILTIREYRKVSKNLTVQYDKIVYLIEDSEYSRRAIGKCIDVYHYPDERKELRLNGIPLPFITYDRLSDVDQGAIVDNKRLGRTLELIKTVVDDKRDNRRSQSVPAGNGPSRHKEKALGKKSQRSIDQNDMLEALVKLQGRSKAIFGKK